MRNINAYLIVIMTLIINISAYAQETPLSALKKTIANMSVTKGMENASFGICVLNANTGEIVAQHDMNRSLITASTMKIITTTSALALLGEDFRYKTVLEYDGEIENGVLIGNLYIKGKWRPLTG